MNIVGFRSRTKWTDSGRLYEATAALSHPGYRIEMLRLKRPGKPVGATIVHLRQNNRIVKSAIVKTGDSLDGVQREFINEAERLSEEK